MNSTVQAASFLPSSSYFAVADEDSFTTLWNNGSKKGWYCHIPSTEAYSASHGNASTQSRSALSNAATNTAACALVALHVNLKWTLRPTFHVRHDSFDGPSLFWLLFSRGPGTPKSVPTLDISVKVD